MLVKRAKESRDAKCEAKFAVEPRGGFWYATGRFAGKIFHRSTHIDDPIIFDPTSKPVGTLEGMTMFELEKLVDENRLAGLTSVWGLDPVKPS